MTKDILILDAPIDIKLTIPNYLYNIYIIGAGGTGGYLAQDLARYIAVRTEEKYNFTIVDGDVVEEKNLIRQNFIENDIGKNKAKVLAERYSKAFILLSI